jgi:hypothetical protein
VAGGGRRIVLWDRESLFRVPDSWLAISWSEILNREILNREILTREILNREILIREILNREILIREILNLESGDLESGDILSSMLDQVSAARRHPPTGNRVILIREIFFRACSTR